MEKSFNKASALSEKDKFISKTQDDLITEKLAGLALRKENYHQVPPIIGMVIADQFGNTILVVEYENCNSNTYSPIKAYLTKDDKSLLEIDLISMYFSSLRTFANQTNIKNLSNFQIHGSNIKVQIYFLLNKFMLILFLNSNTDFKITEQMLVIDYFREKLTEFEIQFEHFNLSSSRKVIKSVGTKAKALLKRINKDYLQEYNKVYSKKQELIDKIVIKIEPVIKNELKDYLEHLPPEILENLSKELKVKIQDKLFDIKDELFML